MRDGPEDNRLGERILKTKTLIRGGWVLTLGPTTSNLTEGDVLIADGRVSEVGAGLRSRDAELVDARGSIVMPGFVDTHRHVWKSLFRNMGGMVPYGQNRSLTEEIGRHFQPDDLYAATLIGLLGAAEAGITTVVDWSDAPAGNGHSEAALQAHADSGLRGIYVRPSLDREETNTAGPLTTPAYGSEDAVAPNLEAFESEWALARGLRMRIHVHAGRESGVVADMARRGLLGEDVTLIHCSGLNDSDFDAVKESGASVALTPSSEMTSGLGSPPIQKLLDRGIRPGLGVDTEMLSPGDLFAQMRATISLQHATYFDLKLAGKAGLPRLLTTRDVIRYGTIDGARVSGLGGTVGSLEPGKQADIIVLAADRPNIFPVNDPIGAVVWGMDTSNLNWVFVGGQVVMAEGVLETDVTRARTLANEARARLSRVAGALVGSEVRK